MKKINDLKVKAEIEILKLVGFLEKNKDAFCLTDLKLHNASYYSYTDMEKDFPLCYKNDANDKYGYFYSFCDDSYNLFAEDLKENFNINFEKIRVNFGRTSKFYLQNFVEFEKNKIDFVSTILNIASFNCLEITKDFDIYISDYDLRNYESDVIEELEYATKSLYNDIVSKCEDCITAYEVLKDFKENQVEYFKEYLECYEQDLKEQKEAEEQEESARLEALSKFTDTQREVYNKYLINSEDLKKLI